MLKNEILKMVATKAEKTQKDVDAVLTAYTEVVLEVLEENREEKITLGTLGAFKVKNVPERKGVIRMGTKSGEEYVTPAHDEITFKMSKTAKML